MRKLLLLLALALSSVAVQVKGQDQSQFDKVFNGGDRGTWTFKGAEPQPSRTVYLIKEGTSDYTEGADGGSYTVPNGIGYMKFEIVGGKAVVYSSAGLTSGATHKEHYAADGATRLYTEYGISNKNFNGTLTLPSRVKLTDDGTTNTWYDVTTISIGAFIYLPITAINIESSTLELIGSHAFESMKTANSYTKVTIKTKKPLTINKDAFCNSPGTVYIDDNYSSYANESRICLANVVIESAGLEIKEAAFSGCEALETVDITSTGIINIGPNAFAADGVSTNFAAAGKNINITKLLPRMWDRDGTTDEKGKNDHIYINGPINDIKSFAFAGHQNIKHIRLIDPRKNNDTGSMTIGTQAFQNAFNGKGVEGTLTIEGPITSIGNAAFWNYMYYNNIVSTTNGNQEEKDRINSGQYQDCLTHVRISNTGNNGLTTTHFLPEHFIQTTDNTAKATLKIEGPITKIGATALKVYNQTKNTIGGSRLREIIIDNKNLNDASATVPDMEIGIDAFYNCMTSDLPDLAGELTITGPCKTIDNNAFRTENGGKLTTCEIRNTSATDLTIGQYAFQYQYMKDDTQGTLTINCPLASIGTSAFQYCQHLHTGTVNNTGNTQTTIGQTSFQRAFGYKGTNYARHFEDGVFSFTGPLATFGNNSFQSTQGLKTLNITSDSEFTIGAYAFQVAYMLSELNYKCPSAYIETTRTLPAKVTAIGAFAFGSTGFTEMTVPSLTLRATNITSRYGGYPCQVEVDGEKYPSAVGAHDMYNIGNLFGNNVFASCRNLERVHFNNSATGYRTFDYCGQLKYVTLGRNVRFIQDGTFWNTSIDTLFIPKEVQVIGDNFLMGQNTRITFESTQPPFAKKDAFKNGGATYEHYPVVPKGCVSAYLFSADDGGFQNVYNDQIACAYKLSAGQNWGSLGTQAHKIKEYKATFGSTSGGEFYRLYTLTTGDDRNGEFTDIYDLGKTGIDMFESDGDLKTTIHSANIIPSMGDLSSIYAQIATWQQEYDDLRNDLYNNENYGIDSDDLTEEALRAKYPEISQMEELKGKIDEAQASIPSDICSFAAYTADYYYKKTAEGFGGKVGIDMVQEGVVVPQHTTDASGYNIGYLVEGADAGATYFLHHFTGTAGADEEKIKDNSRTYNSDGYTSLLTAAQGIFKGENIPCPGDLRESKNGGKDNKTYDRTKAPNLMISWDENHTGYAQPSNFTFDNGSWFGTKQCYYYGFAQGKFRRIGSWANFKEGNAFIAIPVDMLEDGGGDAKATLGLFMGDDNDDNQGGTTGITTVEQRPTVSDNGAWYTLQGVRLQGKPTKSGIYIHNGRKEVVK